MTGKLHFVLHSHLPYVMGHGTWPHGTDWLFEAASETYIPILMAFDELSAKGVPFDMSIGLTPILCEQIAHRQFSGALEAYLEQKITDARQNREVFSATGEAELEALAEMWEESFTRVKDFFVHKIKRDILGAFRELQDAGRIEIITSAATHGYLPLLGTDEAVRGQIFTGVKTYEKHFGRKPRGVWMPECAYRPAYNWKPPIGDGKPFNRRGVEELLHEAGIEWTVADSHLLIGGESQGVYIDRFESLRALWVRFAENYAPPEKIAERTTLKPYLVTSTGKPEGTAFFFRDPDTALQVWSAEWGYPGNPAYLDFHKKHFPGGHRYWRVTGADIDLADKKIYVPEWIDGALEEQADHFVSVVRKRLENGGLLTAPFDAELFGHWWFEGPRWLAKVAEKIAKTPDIEMVSGSTALKLHPPEEAIAIPEGSWGQGGFHYIWLNEWTEWTWRHIYEAERKMTELVSRWIEAGKPKAAGEALEQAARELLLLESSDWQFLISTWSARDYAENRIFFHNDAFGKLADAIERILDGTEISPKEMTRYRILAEQDSPFRNIDPALWAKIENLQ
ncbi:MAG TPA: DUF1957 domain-containing protein [candidate division Zixibacteria bacterium]|nr:DUF1957 domain-containing protein [candidate division Zixibacteria bacterium]